MGQLKQEKEKKKEERQALKQISIQMYRITISS